MKALVSSVTVPCRLDSLAPLSAFVREQAQMMGFDERELSQVQLGVEEAVTNVIKHGLESNPDESFTVVLESSPAALTIRIREKGLPFDPARAPVYSPERADKDTSGLGMFLMRAAMDTVEYHNLGREGKETVLVKHLRNRRIDLLTRPGEPAAAEVPRVAELPGYAIRRARPEEAIEISQCAYRTYGYTYADYIYFPDRIVEYNASGHMVSVVAVTDDGAMMGHAALKLEDPGAKTAELGVAFVNPEFRGHGLLKQMTTLLVDHANSIGLTGLFGQAVTSHPASQKVIAGYGFVDCTLAVALSDSGRVFKAICGEAHERQTLLVSFLPLQRQRRVVHPTARHLDMVKRLYERLAVPFDIAGAGAQYSADPGPDESVRATKDQARNSAGIRVSACTDEGFAIARDQWKSYCRERTDAVFLYVNIEDPRCPGFTARCEELGFFFAGILPSGANGRDALVLQYLNNLNVDYDRLKLHSAEAEELARYVRSCDPNVT